MIISSPSFENHATIPDRFTCQGEDLSPALLIANPPAHTKSFALIVDDPDAPHGTFVHWIAWNIPADLKRLGEGVNFDYQGTNGFGETRYNGPCPPPGRVHRYYFKLYALNTLLALQPGATKQELENAIKGHVIAKAELVGLYGR